ncbi:thiamine biosynthesis protein ThiC [Deferribacter desulfuricans SSM1]|uniref:Phosphomethylpyrimidine synthase n=1 Tax=Deferribacter desulfuricans (strain DSM 14783 / JCM 11476 / NBRC 101012 / SSM1) TaxID=639282 RepID=D3P8N3_DEFDS|nr:phosphomethylpyrimidine synthase ThiC [Deferribacter desulfuricans]BAI81073.1 thiamine biosynthesis protein ThiC [Deferribacter desulfuricans SSM1]
MTQIEAAKKGIITDVMKKIALDEKIDAEELRNLVAEGKVVIPKNKNHNFPNVMGIGKKLRTKINANIGTSIDCPSIEREIKKLHVAIKAGADSIMDLSTGGDLQAIRKAILEESTVMVGAVPIYAVAAKLAEKDIPTHKMDPEELLRSIEEQCKEGIDYITVHCGVTKESVERMDRTDRVCGIVSRGGSILADWIRKNNKENPLFEYYDDLLSIAYKYDVTLSLGDGFRPGAIADATDRAQIDELIILGELAKRAREKNVQAMIEGPGHVPINQIEANILLEKRLCDEAPFYILGPLPTDIAPGYDHITSAIGGAIAGAAGADFLCYVTPAEHLCLPDEEDVHQGVIASKIAAHIADIAKGVPGAFERDYMMSKYRKELNWEGMFSLAIDPERAREKFQKNRDIESCTMCGKLCAVKIDQKLPTI